jgi:outer membrane lipoprotein-sorting protein
MIILLLALSACSSKTASEDQLALQIRNQYLEMQSCEGTVKMLSDYGQRVYEYTVAFSWKKDDDMVLTLEKPDELAGVTARIVQGETMLEYDGARLETGPLSPEGMSPVDAIPATLDYMMKGYIAECGWEALDELPCLRIQFRNPKETAGEGAEAVLWLDKETGVLVRSELISKGATVVQCQFTHFSKG